MQPGASLADALNKRGLRPDDVLRATRYYLAERLDNPAVADLRADVAEQLSDGGELTATVAGDPRLLWEAALGVLSAAWEQTGERDRILRALDDHDGKLPGADLLAMASTLVYGLYLLARTGKVTEERTTLNRDGTYEHRRIERHGAGAILLAALERRPGTPEPNQPGPGLPGEGNFTVLLLDIQDSETLSEADQALATAALRDSVTGSLADLAIGGDGIHLADRGDGWQVLIPDAVGTLTSVVSGLPHLLRKRMGENMAPDVRVRIGIHCGRLRFERGDRWTGEPLVHLARILDDEPLKQRLRASGRHLLTVVSDRAHRETVFARYAEPVFESATVTVKKTTATVWLMLA